MSNDNRIRRCYACLGFEAGVFGGDGVEGCLRLCSRGPSSRRRWSALLLNPRVGAMASSLLLAIAGEILVCAAGKNDMLVRQSRPLSRHLYVRILRVRPEGKSQGGGSAVTKTLRTIFNLR